MELGDKLRSALFFLYGMSPRIVNHCWLHEHQAAMRLNKDQIKMNVFSGLVINFHYKRLGKCPHSTKEKNNFKPNTITSPLGKVGTMVKILPASNSLGILCKNNKTSNSTKPDIKCTYFNESKLWFFFPVQSIHTIWKSKSVFHPLGMRSHVLGNYAVMVSTACFWYSSQPFCCTSSLA